MATDDVLRRIPDSVKPLFSLLKERFGATSNAYLEALNEAVDNDPKIKKASAALKEAAEQAVKETAILKEFLVNYGVRQLEWATGDLTLVTEEIKRFKALFPADLGIPPPPPPKPDDLRLAPVPAQPRIPGGPPGLPRRFLRNRQIRGDIGGGASGLDGGFMLASFSDIDRAGAQGGVIRDLDGTGASMSANFGVDVEGLAAMVDGLTEGQREARALGASLTELKDIGRSAFTELQGVLLGFVETGKFAWQDLARVAIDAIGDMFAAQMKAAGVPSSGGGDLFGAIGGIVGGLLGIGGSARPSFVAPGGAPTPLQLSGPFAHGGSFVVGGSGATDSALVSFLASPGERVDVLTPAQQGGGGAPAVNITQNFDFKGASLEAVALLRREANRIKHEITAEILNSAQRGGAFARMPRI